MEENNDEVKIQKPKVSNGIPLTQIWYYRSFYIGFVAVLGLISKLLTLEYTVTSENFLPTFLPETIGGSVGIAVVPMIIGIVRFFLKKQPTVNIYIIYSVISLVSAYLATDHAIKLNDYQRNSSGLLQMQENNFANSNLNSEGYQFNCSGNEYSVTFESKPKISESAVPFGESILKGTTAELTSGKYQSFCRAECVNVDLSQIGMIDKDYFFNFMNQYSEHTGLSYPSFDYKESSLGQVGSVRGYKTLTDDDGRQRKITYKAIIYYVNRSIMILYVGCPSESYPTRFISKFLNSIKRG